ncbi:MAG: DUF4259 domain-containing protein [Solirubrobacteraceae bacterium]|nr:DUF4259 domain-containing protein [Solirubrobacteraceae bacterium]
MGAWGIEPFDNDDAMDFLGTLEDSSDAAAMLATALDLDPAVDELDAPDAAEALAAAAVVAVLKTGETVDGVPENETGRIAALPVSPTVAAELASAAQAALDRMVQPDSELLALWDEVGEAEEWKATLLPIRAALSS